MRSFFWWAALVLGPIIFIVSRAVPSVLHAELDSDTQSLIRKLGWAIVSFCGLVQLAIGLTGVDASLQRGFWNLLPLAIIIFLIFLAEITANRIMLKMAQKDIEETEKARLSRLI